MDNLLKRDEYHESRMSSSQTNNDMEEIVICSFDIGEKNFAWAKSRVDIKAIKKLQGKNVPYKQRYDNNGECTPEFANFLQVLSMHSTRMEMGKCNLTQSDDKKIRKHRIITNRILARLTNYLEDLNQANVYNDVNYFVIEEQRKVATNNIQLQYHLRGYLIGLFLTFRPIVMMPSKYKTQILGAPKKLWNEKKGKLTKITYSQRKKWAKDRVFSILKDREDKNGLNTIFIKKNYGPPADISDCMLMCEVLVYLVWIDGNRDVLDC